MSHDDQIHNPVEQYMKEIMNLDKPEKPPETTTAPTTKLEVKGNGQTSSNAGSRNDALKIADAIKQSVNLKAYPKEEEPGANRKTRKKRIFDVRRHPVGLIFMFLTVVIGYAMVFSLVSFFLPGFADAIGAELSVVGPIAGLFMLAMVVFGIIILLSLAKIYRLNRLILTDAGITQVKHSGNLRSKSYEIAMSDIKNVSVRKNSILQDIFDYGTIDVETTDGQSNFSFRYASNPNACAKAIQDVRLQYSAGRQVNYP